jgi:glycerol-3-phosphate acyltransferase PlsY
LNPGVALAALIVFVVVAVLARYASLASILGALTATVVSPILLDSGPDLAAVIAIAAWVIWRHRANIHRLQSGTESKLHLRRDAAPPAD